ncbi:NAD-glutamate dehydrogenase [Rothia sp. AR01]|uniref:NAD-glutamate dehydrogenase n=1 Tax=Rothia santali TaxID=2949643 RepID=A0A9X2KLR4_9MICC|nr:NAD-glutamate dehydrogenase domain-containing protein [Rothia santali]MCP3426446.1 NAD-glutamate dehydrogenase [Rothia santali]
MTSTPTFSISDETFEDVVDPSAVRELTGDDPAPVAVRLHRREDAASTELGGQSEHRLRLYLKSPRALSELLPVLEDLGLRVVDQRPLQLTGEDGSTFQLYDFGVGFPHGVEAEDVLGLFEEALGAVLSGRAASDALNRLVLAESLPWRTVAVLRAYTRYLIQLGAGYGEDFMADALLRNPGVTRLLVEIFAAGLDPERDGDREARLVERRRLRGEIGEALDDVPGLEEDRFLRIMADAVLATVRTNAYLDHASIALKMLPREIAAAPAPRPAYEIWVSAPRVEGTHLRFGKVARGGLRWSDRPHDFRTEVLGLVKAQQSKNAVIIPEGAKGGFFPRWAPDRDADPEGYQREGRAAYSLFIGSLLDVTDNRAAGEGDESSVVTPDGVVALDGPDDYLVVAADKGTATFSDLANSISADYGFWLGDAFASGGSVGFDHKQMGITARGAWESVKRHFAARGVDCQREDFTAIGIGGMAGDVFGNGMLRSEHTRLIAAFDTRHIFLDPAPDAAASFAERKRLFELPRAYWSDYDESSISAGGGVYPRSAKSIEIGEEVREALGLDDSVRELAPADLVSAILRAPADLLYTGGAGTYVKATDEDQSDAGDRANDPLRIDASELRVAVIGEGGNLGLTQRARIEAARRGILVNTDAIDNSAGVETSDREVNLKILVDRLVADGELTRDERAAFIEQQVEEVAGLVLRTNREQNVLLQAERLGTRPTNSTAERFMAHLEEHGGLDREVELLPSDEELAARRAAGEPLTSPELAVLTAYSKTDLSRSLLEGGFGADPWLDEILLEYFPAAVGERYAGRFGEHPLRREIICTRVANDVVDTAGIVFVHRVVEETGASPATVAHAFIVAREIFGLRELMELHRGIAPTADPEGWSAVIRDLQRFTDRAVRWVIAEGTLSAAAAAARGGAAGEPASTRGDDSPLGPDDDASFGRDDDSSAAGGDDSSPESPIREVLGRFEGVASLVEELPDLVADDAAASIHERARRAAGWEVPAALVDRWASIWQSLSLLDVVEITRASGYSLREAALLYFAVYERFRVRNIALAITELPRTGRWDSIARSAQRADLYEATAELTLAIALDNDEAGVERGGDVAGAARALAKWEESHRVRMPAIRRLTEEMPEEIDAYASGARPVDLATLSVAVRTLREMA